MLELSEKRKETGGTVGPVEMHGFLEGDCGASDVHDKNVQRQSLSVPRCARIAKDSRWNTSYCGARQGMCGRKKDAVQLVARGLRRPLQVERSQHSAGDTGHGASLTMQTLFVHVLHHRVNVRTCSVR